MNTEHTQPVPNSQVMQFVEKELTTSSVLTGMISHNVHIADVVERIAEKYCNQNTGLEVEMKVFVAKMPPLELSSFDTKLAEAQANCAKALAKQLELREPVTKAFNDRVLKRFTESESRVKAATERIVNARRIVASDIKRRSEMDAQKAMEKANKDNERIRYISDAETHVISFLTNLASARTAAIVKKYHSHNTVLEFEKYINSLKAWIPALSDDEFIASVHGYTFTWIYNVAPLPVITKDELDSIKEKGNKYFRSLVEPQIQILLHGAPQRRLEIESGVSESTEDVVRQHVEDNNAMISSVYEAQKEIISADKMLAVAEVSFNETSDLGVGQAKGVSERKVLNPTTHAHWQAIIKSYIENDFFHLSVPEIEKTFSKILLKANRLGQSTGTWPYGVPLQEDFTIRRTKS